MPQAIGFVISAAFPSLAAGTVVAISVGPAIIGTFSLKGKK